MPPRERQVIGLLRKRCHYCHALLEAAPIDFLPKGVGLPHVRCRRCSRATKWSAWVVVVSLAAGLACAALALVCYDAIAESAFGSPLDTAALVLMLPVGLVAWLLGYLASATFCYAIRGIWNAFRGTD